MYSHGGRRDSTIIADSCLVISKSRKQVLAKLTRSKVSGPDEQGLMSSSISVSRYSRRVKFKIAQMQSAIAATFRNPDSSDFLRTWEVPEKSILRTKILCSRTFSDLERIISLEPASVDSELAAGELALDDIHEEVAMMKILAKRKQQSGNRERSELLGSDQKQARAGIRSNLREGYYVSHSGKKATRVLHHLGRCYMLPGVDYLHLPLVVLRSRIRVPTTLFASGVQSGLSSRTFLDLLGQTLLHQAMIDFHSVEPPQCPEFG